MNKVLTIGLFVAVVFTALAHGAVEPWSVAIFEILMALLLLLWAGKVIFSKQTKIHLPAATLPLGLLVLYGLVQSIAIQSSDGTLKSLSQDVEATRGATLVAFFLCIAFLMAANVLNSREALSKVTAFLVFYGLVFAVFAIAQYFTWEGKFFWFRPTRAHNGFGPFVNRNHFAGYMEMLIPLPVALIVTRAVRKEAWIFYGFIALVMSLALVVSLSRGGMVSLAVGLTFMALLHSRRANKEGHRRETTSRSVVYLKRIGAVVAILAVVGVGVAWLGAEKLLMRVADSIDQAKVEAVQGSAYSRRTIARDSLRVIQAHPILGIGLGAFETVFPAYSSGNGDLIVSQAHNDYLQILADGGLLGGLLALGFLALILRAVWKASRVSDTQLAALAMGSGASIVAILCHSLFDFNLQIPSNVLLFLVHCAIVSYVASVPDVAEHHISRPLHLDVVKVA